MLDDIQKDTIRDIRKGLLLVCADLEMKADAFAETGNEKHAYFLRMESACISEEITRVDSFLVEGQSDSDPAGPDV